MCAIFQLRVRKLTGQTRVPYNRGLRVRGSPHPHDYDSGLPLPATDSNAFRIHSDLGSLARLIAAIIALFSSSETRVIIKIPRFLAFGTVISGMPDIRRITTSHVEKQNHTLRMHCRRLTRLTNAFSKKFENFQAAVALNFAYYNFVKTHKAIRMTSAMAAGVENSH